MTKRFIPCLYAILFFMLVGSLSACRHIHTVQTDVDAIQDHYGVQIHYAYAPENYFPKHWLDAPNSGWATELAPTELVRILPLIERFLAEHPEEVIHKNLRDIYLVDEMNFHGKDYAGTHRFKSIYIACESDGIYFDDPFILGRLHSEFSSILLKYHRVDFPTNLWTRNNPDGFSYPPGNGFEFLGNPALYNNSEQLLTDGFLTTYSTSCLENDFNMMSEWIFTKPAVLAEVAARHERIKMKQVAAQQFYTSISPQYAFH